MKNVILIFVLFLGLNVIAQKRGAKNVNPEQSATLATKKMTLALDLNDEQQTEIYQLNLENATARKAKMDDLKKLKENSDTKKLTTDERYATKLEMLDHQIAQKEKMKSILNDEQFKKWEKMKHHRADKKKREGEGKRNKNSKREKGNKIEKE